MRMLMGLAAVLAMTACNPVAVMGDTETAIDAFHDHWNAGDFEAMWRATHPEFRTGLTRAQFDRLMEDFGEELGRVESSERESFNINTQNGVTTTTVVMRTQFAKGEGLEQFHLREQGDAQRVIYYYVESELLNDFAAPEGADEYRPSGEQPAMEPAD